MFRNLGFIFRKAVVYTVLVHYVVQVEITRKGFYKLSKYKKCELFKYIDVNIKNNS